MSPVERVIEGRPRDLGGFTVRRLLPASGRRTIGPFIFFDQMGPVQFITGEAWTCGRIRTSGCRPSPTCSMARVMHRDSERHVQEIAPGR